MGGTESALGSWLYSQGVSTVLLVLILVAFYRFATNVLPKMLESIQDGYERLQEAHEKQVTSLTETFRRERELERQHVAATTQAIRELTHELKESRKT